MISFDQQLSPDVWTEILQGNSFISFDIISASHVSLYFSESDDDPGAVDGVRVDSWPSSFDFECSFAPVDQRIWAKGNTAIRGVRG